MPPAHSTPHSTALHRWGAASRIALKALLAACALVGFAAVAQVCSPPALLLTTVPPGGLINDYFAPTSGSTLSPGASSLTLGTRDVRGYTTTLVVGDLLMVMQMQDGTINTTDGSSYGDGSGSGSGSTSVGNAGLYEFVRVTSTTGAGLSTGNPTIGFTPKLTNSYANVDAAAGTAQRRFQVIRVLQFASVTTSPAIVAPAWNGNTGGVVSMDVQNTLTLQNNAIPAPDNNASNAAIFVAGKGFRGGLALNDGTSTAQTVLADYVRLANDGVTTRGSGSKAEGFIGTPKHIAIKTNGWGFGLTNGPTALNTGSSSLAIEGYPGGSYGIGAPGNAGGGGTDGIISADSNQYNAGGGGGGNYGGGGIGGRPWNFPLVDSGGRGGAAYAGTLAFNRVFLGGGGGAGSINNNTNDAALPPANANQAMGCSALGAGMCSSGAAGGGVVIIRAGKVAGSGTINAKGAHGYNVANDAAGGGGAGGSIVLETTNGGVANIDVSGGDGGNAWANSTGWPGNRHGPGGAGGGGFIAYAPATMGVSSIVSGGVPGQTMSDAGTAGGPNPEYYGSTGFNGGVTTFQTPNVPGTVQAAKCNTNLSLAKSDGLINVVPGAITSYVLTVTNSGSLDSSGTVTIGDRMTTALSVTPGVLTLSGPYAVQWSCTASTAQDITCQSTASIPSGAVRSFSYTATISALTPNGSVLTNRAQVSGGNDPLKTTTATPATAATCTSTDTPLLGCALDSDNVVAPSLTLSKTDNATQITRGTSVTYVLTVSNVGGSTTVGTITVADVIPIGMTYSGATPFTVNNFTCNVGSTTTSGQGMTCDQTLALAAGSSTSITYTVSVGTNPPASVINQSQVGGGGDPNPGKSTRPTTATAALCASPVSPATNTSDPDTGCSTDADQVLYVSLDLTKDDGTISVPAGSTITYKFTLRNVGTIATTGQLNFRDVLPSLNGTATFALAGPYAPGGTNGANWTCTRGVTNTETFCISNTSIAAGGSSTFNLQVQLNAAAASGTQLFNRSRVGGGGDVSTGMVNSPTVADVTACVGDGNPAGCAVDLDNIQPAQPRVRMSKTHTPAGATTPGNKITFTLVLTNSGSGNAAVNAATMVDYLPTGFVLGSVTLAPATSFTCTTPTGSVNCTNSLAQFTASASITINITGTVAANASVTLVNTARIGATSDSTNSVIPTTTTASICTAVDIPANGCSADTVPLNGDPQILKQQRVGTSGTFLTTPIAVNQLDTVQFQIAAINPTGSAGMNSVTFTDSVPNNFSTVTTVTAIASGGAAGCVVGVAGNLITGFVAALPTSSTCTVVVQAVAASNTSAAGITNTAVITVPSGINDTNLANNSSSVATIIGSANLTIAKTNGVNSLVAGSTTGYTITVANFGPSAAAGTVLTDSASAGLNCNTALVTCVGTVVNMCPASSFVFGSLTSGVSIGPSFPANSTATFVVTCGVTATGQ